MSYSYSQRKKNRKRSRTGEQTAVGSDIRKGKMPKYFFARVDEKLERKEVTFYRRLRKFVKQKLTWRLVSTYNQLTKE